MRYEGKKTTEISFPIGGIGSGCVGLSGNGRLIDWEIFNRPAKNTENFYTHFAVKAEADGKVLDARVLQGDLQGSFMGPHMKKDDYLGYGLGPNTYTMGGFPHFRKCVFDGEFPFAKLTFSDDHFPGEVSLTGFNPFIPLDEDNSSIPAAFFEVGLTNYSGRELTYTVAFSCKNPHRNKAVNRFRKEDGVSLIHMYQEEYAPEDVNYNDLCIATDAEDCSVQEAWYRAGWKDDLITFWSNFNAYGPLAPRSYEDYHVRGGDHCTIAARLQAGPGETVTARFILSWNTPNCYNYWKPIKETVDGQERDITWKNYYAKLFTDSTASALYSLKNWKMLYGKTLRFQEELFAQTFPGKIIEAISVSISVLKSPTVLRLEDGSLYGWEGCQESMGACEGSCTHVWNYAYALPFLFPRLERSMRDLDYKYNWREDGKMEFRMPLPLGREAEPFHACLDGQMGGVITSYRAWKLSGDDAWLRKNWDRIKSALAYAWAPTNEDRWDLNRDGILEGRQHNTLDTEIFGASSWLEGLYLAALKAAAEMAEYFGETEQAADYRSLFANGKKYLEENLWNGSYYFQKIDLNDYHILDGFVRDEELWHDEAGEIKYQIGEGCEIDQIGAQWHADIVGLGEIFDPERAKLAAESMYRNNFKKSVRDHYNPWRLFCIDDEAGAIICDYPEGARKPAIPLSYAEETMHGFEYQLAALLMRYGMIDKALEVVAGVRDRYDGEKRNPFNEIECGSNYSRAMANYSFIPILSGFRFDVPHGKIGFAPILQGDFRAIWSLDACWGNVITREQYLELNLFDGTLCIKELDVPFEGISNVIVDGQPVVFEVRGNTICFKEKIRAEKNVVVQ